jgi:hypothetical protein
LFIVHLFIFHRSYRCGICHQISINNKHASQNIILVKHNCTWSKARKSFMFYCMLHSVKEYRLQSVTLQCGSLGISLPGHKNVNAEITLWYYILILDAVCQLDVIFCKFHPLSILSLYSINTMSILSFLLFSYLLGSFIPINIFFQFLLFIQNAC